MASMVVSDIELSTRCTDEDKHVSHELSAPITPDDTYEGSLSFDFRGIAFRACSLAPVLDEARLTANKA